MEGYVRSQAIQFHENRHSSNYYSTGYDVEYLAQFHEPGYRQLAIAIRTRLELCSSDVPFLRSGNASFDKVVVHFLSGMSACIGDESRCKYILDNNLDDAMATWLEVFEIFCISRRYLNKTLHVR